MASPSGGDEVPPTFAGGVPLKPRPPPVLSRTSIFVSRDMPSLPLQVLTPQPVARSPTAVSPRAPVTPPAFGIRTRKAAVPPLLDLPADAEFTDINGPTGPPSATSSQTRPLGKMEREDLAPLPPILTSLPSLSPAPPAAAPKKSSRTTGCFAAWLVLLTILVLGVAAALGYLIFTSLTGTVPATSSSFSAFSTFTVYRDPGVSAQVEVRAGACWAARSLRLGCWLLHTTTHPPTTGTHR